MAEKLKISIPVVVEGKYDKIKLSSIIDAQILTTDGFAIFASDQMKSLIRRIAEPRGIIILTDSDGAGLVIRNFFRGILPKDKVINLYTPQVEGKEKRKKVRSKAGFLGVEGIEAETLRKLFAPYAGDLTERCASGGEVTKADFYADRLSGGEGSTERRKKLCGLLDLPADLSANALLAAVNMLCGAEKYKELIKNV